MDYIKVFGKEVESLESDINILINLLEQSIERSLEDIEKCRNEAEEIEKELMDKRNKVVEQLSRFRLNQFLSVQ